MFSVQTTAPASPVSTQCPSGQYSEGFTCILPRMLPTSPSIRNHHKTHFIIRKTKTQRDHTMSRHSHWDLPPRSDSRVCILVSIQPFAKWKEEADPQPPLGWIKFLFIAPTPSHVLPIQSTLSPSAVQTAGILTLLSFHQYLPLGKNFFSYSHFSKNFDPCVYFLRG